MPVTPEARQSRRDVKSSISSQFWEQAVHSTKSLDGQLWSLPAEPPPLALTGSSGLSRTQQLIAAQAVRLPFLPSYDGSADGVVLDRVVARAGGRRWWAALSGRVKAQRLYNQASAADSNKLDAVRDLSNYALCTRGRLQLGRRLTLNGVVEAPDVHRLQRRMAQHLAQHCSAAAASPGAVTEENAGAAAAGGADGPEASTGSAVEATAGAEPASQLASPALRAQQAPAPELEPYTAHGTLRCALPGHDLTATAGYNLHYLDSSGDAAHVPLAVSLDLASHDRADGLQYRVGLHQVTAPPSELPTRPGSQQRWRTSLHAQGAVSVEGEAYIWRGGAAKDAGKDKEGAGKEGGKEGGSGGAGGSPPGQVADSSAAAPKQQGKGGQEGGGGAGEEPRKGKLARALDSAAAAEEDVVLPRKQGSGGGSKRAKEEEGQEGSGSGRDGRHAGEASAAAGADAAVRGASSSSQQQAAGEEAAARQTGPAKLEQFVRPLEQLGDQHATHPGQQWQEQRPGGAAHVVPVVLRPRLRHSGDAVLGVSSHDITATIQDSVALLQQVKESVERLTSNVQDGSLQRLSQQLADTRAAPPRRRPYSVLLGQPHLKLNAALGCLARMPLPAMRAFSFPHASLEPLDQPHAAGMGGGSASARHASTTSLASRASQSQLAEAWQPYLKGTALRVFASAGVSGQLGRFARPFLDYTAASARLDVGLTSPHVVGVVPDAAALAAAAADGGLRPDKHRAFALEGRGAWHALSVSLAQQVVGPVRARLDARFALDPSSVPASEGERSTLKGVLQTALSVRPSLLDAAYGFDCVLPGTEGAARLAVWVSPKRRECMAELRLF